MFIKAIFFKLETRNSNVRSTTKTVFRISKNKLVWKKNLELGAFLVLEVDFSGQHTLLAGYENHEASLCLQPLNGGQRVEQGQNDHSYELGDLDSNDTEPVDYSDTRFHQVCLYRPTLIYNHDIILVRFISLILCF